MMAPLIIYMSSFPLSSSDLIRGRRESSLIKHLVPRLRGDDGIFRDAMTRIRFPCALVAVLLAAAAPALAATPGIAAGNQHALVLQANGSVWAWGDNRKGQLGDGTDVNRPAPVQVLKPGSGVIQIAAGKFFSLALKKDGSVWGWGDNQWGQLGDGTDVNRSAPVQVLAPGSSVVSIAAGADFAYALKKDGSVWAWGYNSAGPEGPYLSIGPLGPITVGPAATPHYYLRSPFHLLSARSGIVGIVAGGNFAIARKADGSVWGWGHNDFGQLAGGGANVSQWPQAKLMEPDAGVVALAAGNRHSIALQANGGVWAWGDNRKGQLGDRTTDNKASPVQAIVPACGYGQDTPMMRARGCAGATVVAIAAGKFFSLALEKDGGVLAWGDNQRGQLGDGTTDSKSSPVQVLAPGSAVVAIAAAGSGSLALKADGSLWQWGDLWQDPDAPAKLVPTRVSVSVGKP